MTNLVVGASGATGRLVVEELLNRGQAVKVIVRSAESLHEKIRDHKNISIVVASIIELNEAELIKHVKGCDTVISCLGHTMSFKGIFGFPRRLVTDVTRRLCNAIIANHSMEKSGNNTRKSIKFILMNSSGVGNRDLSENVSFKHKCVITLLRWLLPPHKDNEMAADYLRTEIGQHHPVIEWTAVRPDGMINEKDVAEYEIYPSPIRSAIFEAGQVSRITVGHFMADLASNINLWLQWKGQMPVIYAK